jgi:Amidohydrolase family
MMRIAGGEKSLVRWMVAAFVLGLAAAAVSQQPAEIVIRNGLIVTERGRLQGDLRFRGGTIAEIGRNLTPGPNARVIDATGKLILPGGIDTHVHLTPVRTPTTREGADDFTSASRAALAGGITTIGTFINQDPAVPAAQTLAEAAEATSRATIADALLPFTVGDPTALKPDDVMLLRNRGVTLKIFMRGLGFEQRATENLKLIERQVRPGSSLNCTPRTRRSFRLRRTGWWPTGGPPWLARTSPIPIRSLPKRWPRSARSASPR